MYCQEKLDSVEKLDAFLSIPHEGVVEMMKRLPGDIMILGIAGKMGVTMGRQAVEAIKKAGVDKKVYGVARFSNPEERTKLDKAGVITIACDLSDREQVNQLPQIPNVIFMAGRKFGTGGSEELTWAMNVLVPALVAEHFKDSRIVAFSTGCVYPLMSVKEGGCTEDVPPAPVGEYSQSCLGRERVFEYYSKKNGTKVLLFRLNYSVDLRYGVLHDIGQAIWEGREVNNTVGYFNVIWQGDANAAALRALELADSPCAILNVTGPETATVEKAAKIMGEIMGKEVKFAGTPGDLNYLNDSGKMCALFGYPRMGLDEMIRLQAKWIADGGISIGKPTHFEVNNGKF
jgi:nucleoside-diphosphate-sugar epimerase